MKVWNADISSSKIVQKEIDIDIDLALNNFIVELYDAVSTLKQFRRMKNGINYGSNCMNIIK